MENFKDQYDIEKLKSLYNKYSFTPVPTKVAVMDDNFQSKSDPNYVPEILKVSWEVRDTYQVKSSPYQKIYFKNNEGYKSRGLPEERSDATLRAISKDGKRSVILKTKSDSKSSKSEQYLLIYDEDSLKTTITVKSLNDEMNIIENPHLSTFVLNEDGSMLLCVVEIQEKKMNKDESPASDKEYKMNSHEYKQSWGEKFSNIYHTSIALINLDSRKHILLDKVGISLCQPFFFKSNDKSSLSIGCIGYQEMPYKLGLIYCTNRVSYLFGCEISITDFSNSTQIEPEIYYGNSSEISIRSPKVYYSKTEGYDDKVVFLEYKAGGAHMNSARLQQFDLKSKKIRTIIDEKMKRELIENPDGTKTYSNIGPVFALKLPENCFSNDGNYIIYDSYTPFTVKNYVVNVQDGTIKILNFPLFASNTLNVENDWIFSVGSSLNQLPNVYLARFDANNIDTMKWIPVEDPNRKILSKTHYGQFMFPCKHFPDKYVTGIWTSPDEMSNKPGPTVIIPHGGPHSHMSCAYDPNIALFTELGLKTCLINYIGSVGVDQEYVEALLGKIGTVDVQDVYDSIQYMIQNHHADKDRIILNGGSHGGFLVTNISGQHPELNFLACISRNPVIDTSVMAGITDIPDWDFAEACGEDKYRPPNKLYSMNVDEVSKLYEVSPIRHISKVKVPTLLLLGKEDLRVPYSQGLMYHRLLKAKGIETKCFVYDDVHDLQKINVDFDCFINAMKFLEKFIYYNTQ